MAMAAGNGARERSPEIGEVATVRTFLDQHEILERVAPMVPDTALDVALTPGEMAELANLLKEQQESSLAVMLLSMYIRQRIMNSRLRNILTAAEEVARAVHERKMGLIWDIIAGFRERLGRRDDQVSK